MSDILVDIPDITVIVDKGDEYKVVINKPNQNINRATGSYFSYADTAGIVLTASVANTASFAITALTASYVAGAGLPGGTISSSQQVKEYLPSGTVSSSVQINTGSFTGSFKGDGSGLTGVVAAGTISSSTQFKTLADPFTGSFTGSFRGDGSGLTGVTAAGTVSSSAQINITQTTGYTTFSSSLASVDATQQVSINALNAATSSYALQSQLSGVASSSAQVTNLLPSNVVSSSTQVKALLPNGTVSSSAQYPGWVTASSQIQLNAITGTTFSNVSFLIPQNLTVGGTLTAEKLQIEYITSSVIYESGSTKFGDSSDDTHQFTGSVSVLGSVTAQSFTGSFSGSLNVANTASYVAWNSIDNKPVGLVSSSTQVKSLLPTGVVSSSTQINTGSFSGSFKGDGSQLTGLVTDLRISGSTGSDVLSLLTDDLTVIGQHGITTTVTNNTITIDVPNALTASLYGTASVADAIDIVFAGNYETGSDTPIALQIGGVGNVISASYALTASYVMNSVGVSASYAMTASVATEVSGGGTQGYLTLWQTNSKLSSSGLLYQTASSLILGDGTTFFDETNPDKLGIYAGRTNSFNLVSAHANNNNYLQINIRNFSTGSNSSADIVATYDTGTEDTGYINMGINGTSYVGNAIHDLPGDGYIFTTGSNLVVGTATPNSTLTLFAGGENYSNGKLRIRANNQHELTGSLSVIGSLTVSGSSTLTNIGPAIFSGSLNVTNGITGSLFGTASVAQTALTASYSLNAQNVPAGTVSSSAQYPGWVTSSTQIDYNLIQNKLSGVISSSTQFNALTNTSASFALTASYVPGAASDWNSVANKPADIVSSSTQVKQFLPGGTVSASAQYPGWVTSSTQITQALPTGTVSSSAQYPGWVTSSVQVNTGSFSGSFTGSLTGTITSASYAITASYAQSATAITPAGTVSSSAQYPGWVTSSTQIVWSSVNYNANIVSSSTQVSGYNIFATTGSNTFTAGQTISGSLTVTTGTVVASAITANTSSLYLTSGSNLYVQNNAAVEVTGSLTVTGSFVLPLTAPPSPQTGSMFFSGSFIYVYTGTQYRSASLA